MTPEMWASRYSVKWTGFSVSIVQNPLDNADVCMPLMQGCLPPLLDSTTGVIIALVHMVLGSGKPFTNTQLWNVA